MVLVLAPVCGPEGPREASPLDHLPADIRQLTWWGERPDFRHDGKKIFFLSKVFGDVYEYEIATRVITPCTDHFTHHGFTRALYLSNGHVLLSGPIAPFDRTDKERPTPGPPLSHRGRTRR